MAGTDPYGLFYSGSGITVIAPDQIRPPLGAGELVNPPGYGLRPTLLAPDMPGYNEVVAWVEALSAVAKSNAERGVNHGGGIVGALEQVAAFLQGYQEGGNDGAILILDHLTLGLVPGLNDAAEQVRTANAGSMAYTVADWSAAVGTTTLPGVGGLKALGIGAKAAKATKAAKAAGAAAGAAGAAGGGGAASSLNAARLTDHLYQLERYGPSGFKQLRNGRYRYYGEIKPAHTPGSMVGRRLVREWDPATGATRSWHETIDQMGNIRIVRPVTQSWHYTFDELGNYTGRR
jgi:hypothetical protein